MITGFKIRMPTAKDFSDRLQKAQKFVDSEVLRKSDPYVPLKTGMLRDSGVLGTKIGSGRIRYLAPYARKQYYKGLSTGKRGAVLDETCDDGTWRCYSKKHTKNIERSVILCR